jgi:hypothetical protein
MQFPQTKYLLMAIVPILLVLSFLMLSGNFKNNVDSHTDSQTGSLEEKFAILSNSNTNYCASSNFLDSKADGERLQGSCCSKMDFHQYAEQVEGLKQYFDIDVIPSDPYDIEASLAKKLVAYDKEIVLTAEEQKVYDKAMNMSMEGGPCCCKCWRWTAFEGQAKYLITKYNFDEKQIAKVWDLEDGCGGKGHEDHFEPKST